uniref:Uncharacterized protein n=1 Tax=Acrobeloides nanus TaxID=290746 RepID=A0A914CUN7_9BILA
MNILRLLHLINSCASGGFGVIFCGILIYLIIKKTAKEMKQYSHILLQATIIDMILAFATIFVDKTISPIILIFIPFMILVIPTIAKLKTTFLSTAAVTFMPWVPAINSLPTMYIIKSYRNSIKRTFLRNRQVGSTC